ncbi:MAG: hypothetical protein IPM92_02910 [Saprospiraceae bacterium]|nr:hypothetical protein [Saprospiraceae bacterium]
MPVKKTNWIVKVQDNEFANVIKELKQRKIILVNTLNNISVLVILASPKNVSSIKSLKGIIAVEPERAIGLY